MAKLTRSNIAYDLTVSPHSTSILYEGELSITYVFSSELYLNKFIERCNDHRNKVTESLSKRWGFTIKNELLSDIKLYATIEKRGFLIYKNKEAIECLDNIILDGKTPIKMS